MFSYTNVSRYNKEFRLVAGTTEYIQGELDEFTITPVQFQLLQNYPNPFNGRTTITYDLPKASHVTIDVFDIQGKFVENLLDDNLNPGRHSLVWNANQVSSGVYLLKLSADENMDFIKLLYVK